MPPPATETFSPEQKEYLAGFMAGALASSQFPYVGQTAAGLLTADPSSVGGVPPPRNLAELTVHGTPLADLCQQEKWKHSEHPLDSWERLIAHANSDKAPNPEDNFRFRWFGLFHVSPAQDSFMLRVRLPGGELTSHQLHGLADLAREHGGGCAHVTTRAGLQIRELKPRSVIDVLTRLQDLGLTARGAGADNIRNVTASPDAGLATDELLDVRPFAKAMHHYILNHRDLYDLPRKFNIAFDSGSSLSTAADTNDIGFFATRVTEKSLSEVERVVPNALSALSDPSTFNLQPSTAARGNISPPPGVYFRVQLGGITGHKDFARDTGLLIHPGEAVAVAAAMLRVFTDHGDRTDRKKARLKYLLGNWGVEKFLAETQKRLAFPLARLPVTACEPRRPCEKHSWVGVRRQRESGKNWIGVSIPVGRMSVRQMHALADLATHYGRGELRLTAWQNLLIPHIPDAFVATAVRGVQRLGFTTDPSPATDGIIACTGNHGCKYSGADTKGSAVSLIKHLRGRFPELASPVNFHFTGCPNSCAQHYCGDLGFIGVKLPDGTEGYHVVIGGGMDQEQGIAREIFRGVRTSEINTLVERVLRTFLTRRASGETFVQWSRRHEMKHLQEFLSS